MGSKVYRFFESLTDEQNKEALECAIGHCTDEQLLEVLNTDLHNMMKAELAAQWEDVDADDTQP